MALNKEQPAPPYADAGRVRLRVATEQDLDFIVATELVAQQAGFVSQGSAVEHRFGLTDPTTAYYIVEAVEGADSRPVGYAILCGLASVHRSIELKRIALAETDKGYGRRAVRLLKQLAFEHLGAHRLWLDVFTHNLRAQHVYVSEGFVVEGILRECVRQGDEYVSLMVMSILAADRDAHGSNPA